MMIANKLSVRFVAAAMFALLIVASPATTPSLGAGPDFTQGGQIPEGANHDWNLGATGARGWMFSDKMVTTDARQIAVTQVEGNSVSRFTCTPPALC
jgi:hypothetical protein